MAAADEKDVVANACLKDASGSFMRLKLFIYRWHIFSLCIPPFSFPSASLTRLFEGATVGSIVFSQSIKGGETTIKGSFLIVSISQLLAH